VRRAGAVAAAVALLVPLASCSSGDDDRAYVLTVQGRAQLAGGDVLENGEHQLDPGEEVTVTDGSAVLDLPGSPSLELRAGRGSHADSQVRLAATPTLVAGDALVLSQGGEARLRAGSAMATISGVGRVVRSTGATLAMYRGAARLDALGRTLASPVIAFRQAAVTDTGALPRRPVPLTYDRERPDPWDVRYLGDAIDLGDQLERRSRALDRRLSPPAGVVTPSYVRRVLPPLRTAPGFDDGLVAGDRSIGETMVGASIALGGPGPVAERWRDAFSFRSEGADWGLVAVDQEAQRSAVFGVLDGVLDDAFASGTSSPRSGSTTTTTTTPISPSTPPTTPPPTTPPSTPPPTTIVPEPLGELVDDVLGTVGGLLGPTPD
jgi:hypothetical protein